MIDYTNLITTSTAYALLCESGRTHAYLITAADPLTASLTAAAFSDTLCGKADIARLPVAGGDRVRTEDINWLTGDCWIKPFDSDVKVYLIDKADTMTEQAQNKLLKTLEEPPPSAVVLLAVCREAKMLRTIVSRCRRVRCAGFDARQIYDCLIANGIDAKRADFAAAFSGGSLYLADKMTESDLYAAAADTVFRVFSDMRTSRDILKHAAALTAYKDIFDVVLDFMSYILRDIAIVHAGKRKLVFTKRREADIIELAREFPLKACTLISKKILDAKKSLHYNCNLQNVIDGLLFAVLEIKAANKDK